METDVMVDLLVTVPVDCIEVTVVVTLAIEHTGLGFHL